MKARPNPSSHRPHLDVGAVVFENHTERITMGVMEHKVTTGEKSDGSDWSSTQVRVTAKGMARLALLIAKEPLLA